MRFSCVSVRPYLAAVVLFLAGSTCAQAQFCGNNTITLTSQAAVDAFHTTYGPCNYIEFDLRIQGADISNLSPLSDVDFLHGSLTIDGTALTSLAGVPDFPDMRALKITNNPQLSTISMASLGTVWGELTIRNNPALVSIIGMGKLGLVEGTLMISDNLALTSIAMGAPEGFIGDSGGIISNNAALTTLAGLKVKSFLSDLLITSNLVLADVALPNLKALGNNLLVVDNPALVSLSGLGGVSQLLGQFRVENNPALLDLALISLPKVDSVLIYNNASLASLAGLGGLTEVNNGDLRIGANAKLTSLSDLGNLISVTGRVEVYQHPLLSSCGGLRRLLDAVDDGAVGPGPGTAGIPDVGTTVNFNNNKPGCNSAFEALNTIHLDGFE